MLNFKRNIFIAILFIHHGFLLANTSIKYGEITAFESAMTECSFEKEAPAVYLNYCGEIKLSNSKVLVKKHIRIKILNEKGIEHANVKIPFYVKNGYEKITDIKAQSININDKGDLVFSEVKDHHFYTIDISPDWKEVRFAFPNARPGSILEFEYTVSTDNILYLDDWKFQLGLPIIHSQLEVLIPETLNYKVFLQGNRLLKKYRDVETNFWELDNVPSAKDEPFLFNKENFIERIQFQLMGYRQLQEYEGMVYKSLMNSWENLANEVMNSYAYRSYLNKTSIAKTILSDLNLKGKNQEEKLGIIYGYVINNFHWNSKYRRYTYNKFSDFFAMKSGYSSEINLFLTLLLNEAGIEAHPLLLSTRSNGGYLKDHPFLSQFNHLGIQVLIDGRELYIDATDPFRPYFLPDIEMLVDEGFVLNKRNPDWWKLPETGPSIQKYQVEVQLNNGKASNISVELECNNYYASENRKIIFRQGKEVWAVKLFNNLIAKDIDQIKIENLPDINSDLKVKANLIIGKKNYYLSSSEIHVKPFILSILNENPFKDKTRNYPIQLPFVSKLDYTVKIKVPTNYLLKSMPENERILLPNGYGDFTCISSIENGIFSINWTLSINEMDFPASQNENIREFYSLIVSRLNTEIIFQLK